MPYSKKAKYEHHRKKPPSKFIKSSFRNVPISHVSHRKKYPRGTRAIVGKLKSGKYATQSILIPKKKRR
jgi:hypothetical protein